MQCHHTSDLAFDTWQGSRNPTRPLVEVGLIGRRNNQVIVEVQRVASELEGEVQALVNRLADSVLGFNPKLENCFCHARRHAVDFRLVLPKL